MMDEGQKYVVRGNKTTKIDMENPENLRLVGEATKNWLFGCMTQEEAANSIGLCITTFRKYAQEYFDKYLKDELREEARKNGHGI